MKIRDGDRLFRHSAVLFIAGMAMHACNLLFQAVMGRMLTESAFGDLTSMVNVVLMVSLPASALSSWIVAASAKLAKSGNAAASVRLALKVCGLLTCVALPVLFLGMIGAGWLAEFFQIGSPNVLRIASVALVLSLYFPVFTGVLQGLERFELSALSSIISSILRVVIAPALVFLGFSVAGALTAQSIGFAMALLVSAVGVHRVVSSCAVNPDDRGVVDLGHRDLVWFIILFGCFGFLLSADMMFVKHFFEPEEAGVFARASIIGKMSLMLSAPVATAMFPKVVSVGRLSRLEWRTFTRAMAMVILLVLCVVCGGCLMPQLPLWLLGNTSASMFPLVRRMLVAVCPLAVAFPILHFLMAQRRFAVVVPLVVCLFGYVLGLNIWHDSTVEVTRVFGVMNTVFLIGSVLCLPFRKESSDNGFEKSGSKGYD